MKRVHCLLAFVFIFAVSAICAARLLNVDDVVSIRRITLVQISPDGSLLAYTLEEPNDAAHSKLPPKTVLTVMSLADGQSWKVGEGADRVASPKWSPDSRTLAFLSVKSGVTDAQIYLLDAKSRAERQLTHQATAVRDFNWSPDGSSIAYLAAPLISQQEQRRDELGYDEIHVGPGPDQEGRGEELWTVSLADGQSRRVETNGLHILAYQWSLDGRTFLLTVAATRFSDEEQLRPRLVTLSVSGGAANAYCPTVGKLTAATWSPDGSTIAFLGTSEGATDPFPGGLFICRAGSKPRNIIPDTEFTVESYRWMPDGQSFIVVVAEGAHRAMARIRIDDGALTRLTHPPLEVAFRSPYSSSADGRRIACVLSSAKRPPDIWLLDDTGNLRQLTHINPQLDGISFAESEEFRWQARDGLPITGVLIIPVNQPAARCPLIVQVHGSQVADTNEFQASWMNWGQLLAANGYMVLLPNYRGSLTSGARFARANQGDLGGKDFTDILDGVDALIRNGTVDPERLGIGGVSYGGFLTGWAVTHTARFKAAVMGLGIGNWISMAGETPGPESMVALYWQHSPYEEWQVLWNRSLLAHGDNAHTPTLIYAGERDPLVPFSQSREFFRALQHYKVPSEFIIYPREGHSVLEPNHLGENLTRIVQWFNQYLK